MADNIQATPVETASPAIEVTQATPTDWSEPAGVPDGTIIKTPQSVPDEKIVQDYDDTGNIIGWHKELV